MLLKKIIKPNYQVTFLRYKTYRDKINHLIRKSKKKYYNDFFQKTAQDIKKTWKQFNSIIYKDKIKDVITFIKTVKGFESDPHRIANYFDGYFTNVAKNLVSKTKTKHNFRQFLDKPIENSVSYSN